MSASDGLYGVAFKTELLRSLLRDYVPDEKHPFSDPSELSDVVSAVKTHKLLAEWTPQPLDQNLMDSWKSAVDSWVNRLLSLVSSNLPVKCWAGICLLGITCQECNPDRFLSSYADWLNKLISQVQLPAVSHFVKVAACASISDLFTRLSGFAKAKKDGTSHATRVISPVLKLLTEDSSSVILEEAMSLICTMINFFPSSIQRHYDSVEDAIASKLLLGQGCSSVSKKLGYTLSLLPKSKGDAESWALLMVKILLCMNSLLTDALQGLEEESRSTETMRALLPSGKESPSPLGGLAVSEQIADLSTRRPEQLLGSRISALMQCCCDLLTNSYPIMVSVPIHGIVSLARRALMIDSSLSPSSYAFMTTMKHEYICSEIPLLQSRSLEMLAAVVEGLSSQILPHAANITQLLNEYLRSCKFPDLRRKAYLIVKDLLTSMGIGMAIHWSQDIVSNVLIDLVIPGGERDDESAGTHTKVHTGSRQKKRKHSSIDKSIQEQPADGLEVELPQSLTQISLRIAALETLEALLTVGGSVRAESWRAKVNRLLINVAANACKGGSPEEKRFLLSGDHPTFTWATFQLAALRALLASLFSPGRVRPPHLALSLKLFRRGAQETGTKLAEFCGHALLSLEVLIHPRALPLSDLHSSPDEYSFQSLKYPDVQIFLPHAGTQGKGPGESKSEDDDLDGSWLGNDDDMEIQDTEMLHTADDPERPATARDPSLDKLHSIQDPSGAPGTVSASVLNNSRINVSNNDMFESSLRSMRDQGTEDIAPMAAVDASLGTHSAKLETVSTNATTFRKGLFEVTKGAMPTSEQQVSETKDDRLNIVERISATLTETKRSSGLEFESDNEESIESIPDIVDGDPDSD